MKKNRLRCNGKVGFVEGNRKGYCAKKNVVAEVTTYHEGINENDDVILIFKPDDLPLTVGKEYFVKGFDDNNVIITCDERGRTVTVPKEILRAVHWRKLCADCFAKWKKNHPCFHTKNT